MKPWRIAIVLLVAMALPFGDTAARWMLWAKRRLG